MAGLGPFCRNLLKGKDKATHALYQMCFNLRVLFLNSEKSIFSLGFGLVLESVLDP